MSLKGSNGKSCFTFITTNMEIKLIFAIDNYALLTDIYAAEVLSSTLDLIFLEWTIIG